MSNNDIPRQRTIFGWGVGWIIGGLVVIAAVVAVVTVVSTGSSGVRGAAGAHRQKESTPNRVFAQAHFQDLNAAVEKDVANIRASQEALKADPTSAFAKTNLTGVVQICNADVTDYNADSGKYLLRDFKSAGLPATHSLDECQPTK